MLLIRTSKSSLSINFSFSRCYTLVPGVGVWAVFAGTDTGHILCIAIAGERAAHLIDNPRFMVRGFPAAVSGRSLKRRLDGRCQFFWCSDVGKHERLLACIVFVNIFPRSSCVAQVSRPLDDLPATFELTVARLLAIRTR
ncbi:hypothetical protein (plasmid) [Enterobacter hormaechei subsp. xiangfangensis]|uniref:Uncharacterized protein n=4 Tax=Enterobacteriaceae TaxID=543 RepID=A0A0C5H2X4_KLEPN|nr:hypothetical protein [Enterobacter hormaechei subsp. oharae]AJP18494.1 hypothetical protein [Klebsiella pneumoniae]UOL52051.1 hypothetical protein [Enterobacter hormaechei subsp. steigerwaltii]UOL52583.1 hypothetical protein [Enterobacter hormaechei subsp. xiangfangensis]BAN19433.1 hypothetical protein KPX_A0208 [Klebsiella pneumoniae subsp. pneumoniae KPX]